MLPPVRGNVDVEMIRDGGSFAACFDSDCGSRYMLFIKIVAGVVRPMSKQSNYEDPVLIDCDPNKRPRDVDGIIYSDFCGLSVAASWSDARDILEEISAMADGLSDLHLEWLRQMKFVVEKKGRLRPSES